MVMMSKHFTSAQVAKRGGQTTARYSNSAVALLRTTAVGRSLWHEGRRVGFDARAGRKLAQRS